MLWIGYLVGFTLIGAFLGLGLGFITAILDERLRLGVMVMTGLVFLYSSINLLYSYFVSEISDTLLLGIFVGNSPVLLMLTTTVSLGGLLGVLVTYYFQ